MSFDELKGWATAIGAVIAAIAASWNLILQFKGKQDRFKVMLGSLIPNDCRKGMISVVSLSDHQINLADWGYIDHLGNFHSIRMYDLEQIEDDPDTYRRGSSELTSFGDYFETTHDSQSLPAGAYAISVTQNRPQLYFTSGGLPHWRRLIIRAKLIFQPNYFMWSWRIDIESQEAS